MAALVQLVVVNEVVIRPLGPASRRLVALVGKDADGGRDGDVDGAESGDLVLPVQTSRRNRRVGQPVQGDVVQKIFAGEVARRRSLRDLADEPELTGAIPVVNKPGSQASG